MHRELYGADQPFRRVELVGGAGPDRQHEVGGDDRDADGDQGLPQVVAPHASEDQHLQQDAGDRDGEEGDGEADEPVAGRLGRLVADRSEEHTSELQSLMRISYAVFCLKKTYTDTL